MKSVVVITHGTFYGSEFGFRCEKCGCGFRVGPDDDDLEWIVDCTSEKPKNVLTHYCPECRTICKSFATN